MCITSLFLIRRKGINNQTLSISPGISVKHTEMKLYCWHLWSAASHLALCQQSFAALRNTQGSVMKVTKHTGPGRAGMDEILGSLISTEILLIYSIQELFDLQPWSSFLAKYTYGCPFGNCKYSWQHKDLRPRHNTFWLSWDELMGQGLETNSKFPDLNVRKWLLWDQLNLTDIHYFLQDRVKV